MLHITKQLALGLGLCMAVPAFSQQTEADLYAMITSATIPTASTLSVADEIEAEIERIIGYTNALKTADRDEAKDLQRKIEAGQVRIRELSKAMPTHNRANYRIIKKYNFDVMENSLALDKFRVVRNGTQLEIGITIKSSETGTARVDIVSPGGELIDTFSRTDFSGKLHENVALNATKGMVYFMHIRIGDKATTKKVRFD